MLLHRMNQLMLVAVLATVSGVLACDGIYAADYSVRVTDTKPDGLSKEIARVIAPAGQQLVGKDGPLCTFWLTDSLAVQAKFSPTLNVNYPFQQGQLIGVMQVEKGRTFEDFRGQEIPAGTYTLRYGRQPEDGNHIGTSDLYDFLLAIPNRIDTKTAPIDPFQLPNQSAQSAGSSHPAIFSLLPQKAVKKSGTLTHDDDHDFWLLDLIGKGKAGEKVMDVKLRMVVIGRSEA